jgi:ankyrin repeat protein
MDRSWQSTGNLFRNPRAQTNSGGEDSEDGYTDQLGMIPQMHTSTSRSNLSQAELLQFHESWTTGGAENLFGVTSASVSFGPQPCVKRPPTALPISSPLVDMASGLSSSIHDAARITNWDRVLELCASYPEDAKYAGRDGWTALHHACNRRCPRPEVAEALIRAYPGALNKPDEKGWLPLHYACRFKAPKAVVQLLLQMHPRRGSKAVSKTDRQGRTPLYYAVRYDAPPGVVGLLLQVDPSAVLEEDQNDESPLNLLWDSWAEKLEGKRIVNSYLPGGFPEPEDRTVEERAKLLRERLRREPKLYQRWLKVNMLLKAAFGLPVEGDENERQSSETSLSGPNERVWRIVHATASVKCHPSLFLMACALHPEQVQMLDKNDLQRPGDICPEGCVTNQTALHLAASSNEGGEPGKTVLLTLLSQYREAAQIPDSVDGSLPLHRMVENEHKQDWSNHAAILYRFYPRAVQIPDNNGKLPLHRAIPAMKSEDREAEECIVTQLVRVFPQAASHADNSGLLPMHLIAMHSDNWHHETDTVCNANRNAVASRCGASYHHRLAIHLAAASSRSRESLIARLLQLHQRSAALEDSRGCLPLHLACEVGKDWNDGVRAIYAAFPEAVRRFERNERGWTPLHLAANAPTSSPDLISKLVELYPDATEIADRTGQYPLHLACRSGLSWTGGLECLFEAAPFVMTVFDHAGFLPFHRAAIRACKKGDDEQDNLFLFDSDEESDTTEEKLDTSELENLYQILRADPTVLHIERDQVYLQ